MYAVNVLTCMLIQVLRHINIMDADVCSECPHLYVDTSIETHQYNECPHLCVDTSIETHQYNGC